MSVADDLALGAERRRLYWRMVADLDRAIADALRAEPGVVAAYLFGSHAAERAHRESDIDIGVLLDRSIFPTEDARFDARLRLTARLGAALASNVVDLVVLNDVSPVFARAVICDGRRVLSREPELVHAFFRDTLLRAADLEPWLRRMRRTMLDAIAP